MWDCVWIYKDLHAIAKDIHYGVIRCFIGFYYGNGNYFTHITNLAIQGIKQGFFAPKTNNGIQPKLNAVCSFVTQSCSTDAVK